MLAPTDLRCYNCETDVNVELRSISWTGLTSPFEAAACPYCWQATESYAARRTKLDGRRELRLLELYGEDRVKNPPDILCQNCSSSHRIKQRSNFKNQCDPCWSADLRKQFDEREEHRLWKREVRRAERIAEKEARRIKVAEDLLANFPARLEKARLEQIEANKLEYINRERRSFLDFDSMHGNQASELIEQDMSSILTAYRQDHPVPPSDDFPYHDEPEPEVGPEEPYYSPEYLSLDHSFKWRRARDRRFNAPSVP